MPRTKLTEKYSKRPAAEFDEDQVEQRRKDTEALVASEAFQRDMAEGAAALEVEIAAAKAKATKSKPGPKPLTTDDGERIKTAKQARKADLRSADQRAADAARFDAVALEYHPEDDPDVPVQFGDPYRTPAEARPKAVHAGPAGIVADRQPLIVDRHVTVAGYEVLTEPFTGRRRIDPVDPDDPLAVPTIEERIYRITGDMTDYVLEMLVNGVWQEESRGYEVGSLAHKFAMQRAQIDEAFHAAARTLPLHRPLTAAVVSPNRHRTPRSLRPTRRR